ncbi:MAG: hypothetical protein R2991_09570 [Thermoanaerobaculia bacterium]
MRVRSATRFAAAAGAFALCVSFAFAVRAQDAADGQTLFVETYKCNTCHSVQSAEIAVKSEKMFSTDLGGFTTDDPAALGRYLRKEEQRDGADHKKGFTGTDEELATILEWLAGLEPAPEG